MSDITDDTAKGESEDGVVLCLASFFKGNEFLRECRRRRARVVLLTRGKLLGEAWAREALEDLVAVTDPRGGADSYLEAAVHVARRRRVRRVVALEEYDVLTAALVREDLCLPGAGSTVARRFQDKLTMRAAGRAAGLDGPDFVHLLNGEEVERFLRRAPGPWVLKPRTGASAMGIRILRDAGEVWRVAAELDRRPEARERAPHHLLETYVEGAVYHVDSVTAGGRLLFACVSRYGSPPLDVAQRGGVSTSRTVRRNTAEERLLLAANRKLLKWFGLRDGVTHAEFIRGEQNGRIHLLEVAARVGGAHTAELVEAATGVNLWREWARVETATEARPYEPPAARADYGGVAVSLARQECPDTSPYDDPEIVFRVNKPWHAGLVVSSQNYDRVAALLADYERRFAADFLAVAPPEETPEQHL
jgi:biotin carboxylase